MCTCNKFFEKLLECNDRSVQFTTMDSHLSAYAGVLESTQSHTSKTVFPSRLRQSCVTCSLDCLQRWTHSKCFGEILQHAFFTESMTSVLCTVGVQSTSRSRVTTCLENLEMSGNLTAVREMSGILLKFRETFSQGKVTKICSL